MTPGLDAACEAARLLVERYSASLTATRVNHSWARRLEAHETLWSVLEDADALLQAFPEDAPRGEREALITLAEYWHEIEPLPPHARMENESPETPSLHQRGVEAYRHTVGRIHP